MYYELTPVLDAGYFLLPSSSSCPCTLDNKHITIINSHTFHTIIPMVKEWLHLGSLWL